MTSWLLNTGEAEPEGRDADIRMLARSVVAAWGATYGAEKMLAEPEVGDRVYIYLNGVGIIATGVFDHSSPFPSGDIFRSEQQGEFSRKVVELIRAPKKAVSPSEVETQTGYRLPAKGRALVKIHSDPAIAFLLTRFGVS